MSGPIPAGDLEHEVPRLRALVEASRLVNSSLDLDELLDNILTAATSTIGATRGTVYVCDHDEQQLWSRVTAGSERVEIRLPFGKGLAGFTAVSGEPLRANDVRRSPLFDPEVDKRTGFRTENAVCAPIRDREGSVTAVIQLLNKSGGFTDADMEFLDAMGVHVAQALANSQAQQMLVERQKLIRELELARRIQELLLPSQLPKLKALTVAARMVTSRLVGGDYYDVVPLGDGRSLFILADVSGKGVAASLVMSNLQAALWASASLGRDLASWSAHLNDILHNRLEGARYVTAFLAAVDLGTRRAQFVNAGHPPGLLWGPTGGKRLDSTGPPLGLLPGQAYATGEFELRDGESLLLYSDGLTEAADDSGVELGVDGLEKLLARNAERSANAAADDILEAVESFGVQGEADDRTLLLLKARSTEAGDPL